MILLICYPRCSTCKKAQEWLASRNIEYTYRDIKTANPSAAEIAEWHRKSGLPLKRLWNTSGMAYRSLKLKERLPKLSAEAQYQLLASDGMLVKRPILIANDRVLIGFHEQEWASLKG